MVDVNSRALETRRDAVDPPINNKIKTYEKPDTINIDGRENLHVWIFPANSIYTTSACAPLHTWTFGSQCNNFKIIFKRDSTCKRFFCHRTGSNRDRDGSKRRTFAWSDGFGRRNYHRYRNRYRRKV